MGDCFGRYPEYDKIVWIFVCLRLSEDKKRKKRNCGFEQWSHFEYVDQGK